MKLSKAIALSLGNLDQPVVTSYELCGIMLKIFTSKHYGGERVDIRTSKFPDKMYYGKTLNALIDSGVLVQHKDFFKKGVFQIVGKKEFDAGDVVCSVDPFAYMSHLCAMSFHGITDRIPSVLIVSSPAYKMWVEFAYEKMRIDLGENFVEYSSNKLPKLKKLSPQKLDGVPVVSASSIHHGAFRTVRGRSLRVATIGRTFLDMVRKPGLCGGIRHVVDTFKEYGGQYGNLIIDEVERHGNKIEKVRCGYLLENVAGISDARVEKWLECVQRGGSRRLDPNEEYSPVYNERWCLSINAD